MSKEITGIFNNVDKAQSALTTLVGMGIPRQKISVLMSDDVGRKNFKIEGRSKAPEGVATGAVAGGLIGAGMTENEAKLIEKNLSAGSVLIGVESPDDMSEDVRQTFKTSGAESITRH